MAGLSLPFQAGARYFATAWRVLFNVRRIVAERIAGEPGEFSKAFTFLLSGIGLSLAIEALAASVYNYRFDAIFFQLVLIVLFTAAVAFACLTNYLILVLTKWKFPSFRNAVLAAIYLQGAAVVVTIAAQVLGSIALIPLWSRIRVADLHSCSPLRKAIDPICGNVESLEEFIQAAVADSTSPAVIASVTAAGLIMLAFQLGYFVSATRSLFAFNYHLFEVKWWRIILTYILLAVGIGVLGAIVSVVFALLM